MNYSQFIHGKVAGERNYKIVAHTADLAGRETELENIAQQYRFWGQQPPEANPIAVGVFQYQDGLLLAQAMSATYSDGRAALDGQGRPFSQHRYIFLSPESIQQIAGRWWLLLDWVMAETRGIPVFEQVNKNLRSLSPPYFDTHTLNHTAEREKLSRSLQLLDETGQRLLLSSLASLIHGKRIVIDAADHDNIFSEDLLEGLLLLLPTTCREQVSIAAGAIDETVCTQAALMVKTNGTPVAPMASDLIWMKRATNQLYGLSQETQRQSDYTSLLSHILTQPDSLPLLHRILDDVNDQPPASYPSVWQALNNGWLATRLIPALPNPAERENYWRTTLKGLSPDGWQAILPAVVDEIGLEIAWAELQKATKRDPERYTPLVFRLWQNFSDAYITYAIEEEISADPALGEALLRHGLMTHFTEPHQSSIYQLALNVIHQKAKQTRSEGLDLAQALVAQANETDVAQQMTFLDAALVNDTKKFEFLTFFNEAIIPLLPQLSLDIWHASRSYQQLNQIDSALSATVDTVIKRQQKAADRLPALAQELGLTLDQTSRFYAQMINHWEADERQLRLLLAHLLLFWAHNDIESRPTLLSLMASIQEMLRPIMPTEAIAILSSDTVTLPLESAETLAQYLWDDVLDQIQFVDQTTDDASVLELCQRWLLIIAENGDEERDVFAQSYTWQQLQADGPVWLAEAIPQILDWQATPLSALLPIIERMQSALDLPQTVIFQLLKSLPKGNDSSLGMILGAYLPALSNAEMTEEDVIEAQPLWQMLQAQAPKVAQVFKVLAEGQHNVAVDLFNQRKLNGALNEAPEYAEAMAQWLQVCGKGNWISGRLLETIVDRWLSQPEQVDAALLAGLLQPDLTRQYHIADWIALARVCWLAEYQVLWPITGQPDLSLRQQSQVLSIATACIVTYDDSQQVERLLSACQCWGLPPQSLAQLLASAPKTACNFRLVSPYLDVTGTTKKTTDGLLRLAISMTIDDALDQAAFKTFLTNLSRQHLGQDDGISFLVNGYHVALFFNGVNGALNGYFLGFMDPPMHNWGEAHVLLGCMIFFA
ncbi:MAG: hypothetical protein AAF629_05190, partial [Chloroflexota bacterium]